MTLPTSGTITMQNFNTELGLASTANNSMSFIYSKALSQVPAAYNFAHYYGYAYFKSTTGGNCNNGNCGNCNCGNITCTDCQPYNSINCVNCQSQSYLQTNCNCACTYNCGSGNISYNCNCACDCACGC